MFYEWPLPASTFVHASPSSCPVGSLCLIRRREEVHTWMHLDDGDEPPRKKYLIKLDTLQVAECAGPRDNVCLTARIGFAQYRLKLGVPRTYVSENAGFGTLFDVDRKLLIACDVFGSDAGREIWVDARSLAVLPPSYRPAIDPPATQIYSGWELHAELATLSTFIVAKRVPRHDPA